MLGLVVAVGLVIVLVIVIVGLKFMWRVAEPNEALIISGLRTRNTTAEGVEESLGFKIVTGKGTFVLPGIQAVRKLLLHQHKVPLGVECVTKQGIPVSVQGVVIFKVGDDFISIANAARRFLDQQDKMDELVHEVFAGHLRVIIGQLTVEDMIRDREALRRETIASSSSEMQKLGLIIDSLQIKEIDDPTGYITNLGKPESAAVASRARIAQAQFDYEATQKEQENAALKAAAQRDSNVKQAVYQAEIDQAMAKAKQAGPLSQSTARQEVVVRETEVAKLEAALRAQKLEAEIRRPADAEAYRARTVAEGARDARIAQAQAFAQETELRGKADATAIVARGNAEADAMRAKGLSEATAIEARAKALSENQEAVIGQQLAEHWAEIVAAAAKPLSDVDQIILLNGAEGLSQILAQTLSQGVAGLQLARNLLSSRNGSNDYHAGQQEKMPEKDQTDA